MEIVIVEHTIKEMAAEFSILYVTFPNMEMGRKIAQ